MRPTFILWLYFLIIKLSDGKLQENPKLGALVVRAPPLLSTLGEDINFFERFLSVAIHLKDVYMLLPRFPLGTDRASYFSYPGEPHTIWITEAKGFDRLNITFVSEFAPCYQMMNLMTIYNVPKGNVNIEDIQRDIDALRPAKDVKSLCIMINATSIYFTNNKPLFHKFMHYAIPSITATNASLTKFPDQVERLKPKESMFVFMRYDKYNCCNTWRRKCTDFEEAHACIYADQDIGANNPCYIDKMCYVEGQAFAKMLVSFASSHKVKQIILSLPPTAPQLLHRNLLRATKAQPPLRVRHLPNLANFLNMEFAIMSKVFVFDSGSLWNDLPLMRRTLEGKKNFMMLSRSLTNVTFHPMNEFCLYIRSKCNVVAERNFTL